MDVFREVCHSVAGLVFLVGYIPYIRAILKGNSKPEKATWLIWSANDTILLAGMYAEGALNGQMIGVVSGGWIVFFLSLRYGVPGWSRLDQFCLASSAIGIALWVILDNPLFGIVISLSVGVIGSLPTIQSAWKNPDAEDKVGWTLWCASCLPSLLAIPQFTFADTAQPVIFAVLTSMMVVLVYRKVPNVPTVETINKPSSGG